MMRMTSVIAASLALCLAASAASAQTAAPAAPAAPPAMAPAGKMAAPAGKMAKPRTAQSIACSADADKQGLHGKPRKTFMSSCKHKAM